MAGQFYLGEAIKFTFLRPVSSSVDLVTGSVSYSQDYNTPSLILTDAAGNSVIIDPNSPPAYVSIDSGNVANAGMQVTVAAAYPTTTGRWRCILTDVSAAPQVDYCDVLPYYNPLRLTQKFQTGLAPDNASALVHYEDLMSPPVQYQYAYNIDGGYAATYADITSVSSINVVP